MSAKAKLVHRQIYSVWHAERGVQKWAGVCGSGGACRVEGGRVGIQVGRWVGQARSRGLAYEIARALFNRRNIEISIVYRDEGRNLNNFSRIKIEILHEILRLML
jgi:hypothetical protein